MATAAKNFPWKLTFVQTWLQHFAIIRSWSNSVFLTKHSFKCLAGMLLKLILRMRHLLSCAHVCRQNRKFGNFTLPLGRLRQWNVLKWEPHVQHHYFSSYYCFVSLLLLKLPITIVVCFSYTAPLHEYIFFLPLHGLLCELILFRRNKDVSNS